MKFLASGFGHTQTSVLGHLESKLVGGRSLSLILPFKKKKKNHKNPKT